MLGRDAAPCTVRNCTAEESGFFAGRSCVKKLGGVEEVAGMTGVRESTIRRMLTGGRIPCFHFDPDDIAMRLNRSVP